MPVSRLTDISGTKGRDLGRTGVSLSAGTAAILVAGVGDEEADFQHADR
ncbi:hypothetical protein ABTZ99_10775 [Actinosynnema sp. NPDC002837]